MTDHLLDLIAAHLDDLRQRADHLDAIRLHSGARWLRQVADRLEDAATQTEGVTT